MDLEQVAWKRDAAGRPLNDLDKSDPRRTHTSDGLGYWGWALKADPAGPKALVIL